jgi:hypothetical protein
MRRREKTPYLIFHGVLGNLKENLCVLISGEGDEVP